MPTCEECYRRGFKEGVEACVEQAQRGDLMPELGVHDSHNTHNSHEPVKKKRKVSKYQKEFGKQMKKLKAAHPRTKITGLMSRGHTATRKALGMKRRR